MFGVLEQIKQENDIKKIEEDQLKHLAEDIRHFLVSKISHTGGHLASNLGVVELTMALHLNMSFPEDKLIWDVGHQAYTHKVLTGRREGFRDLRQYGGISGFPKSRESDCDAFDMGHSSTSISVALGMAIARDLKGEHNKVVAVIGDGALSGGMAYEALNNAARLRSNLIIILNDNNMSISENVGGMANYLGKIRTNSKYTELKDDVENALKKLPKLGTAIADNIRRSKASLKQWMMQPGMLFENMGLTYIGPIDGHDLEQLNIAIHTASKGKEAVIIHVITKKGKGYRLAEKNPQAFHGIEPFHPKNGELRAENHEVSYTKVFGRKLAEMAETEDKLLAVTAAMPSGTGLVEFQESYPDRFFDVGIAEEHAVTFAAGLAKGGYIPVVAIYSTFLQRSYDQILHDVCLNKAPVILMVDRAGIVGNDGETHQGIFDLSYLCNIPGLTVMAPKNRWELEEMMEYAVKALRPVAIRYPRGTAYEGLEEFKQPLERGKGEILYQEQGIALLAVGSMVHTAKKVREILKEKGYSVSLINVRFVAPFDREKLLSLCENHNTIVTMEENVRTGGFGERAAGFLLENGKTPIKWVSISIPDQYVPQGNAEELLERLGLSAEAVAERILAAMEK